MMGLVSNGRVLPERQTAHCLQKTSWKLSGSLPGSFFFVFVNVKKSYETIMRHL